MQNSATSRSLPSFAWLPVLHRLYELAAARRTSEASTPESREESPVQRGASTPSAAAPGHIGGQPEAHMHCLCASLNDGFLQSCERIETLFDFVEQRAHGSGRNTAPIHRVRTAFRCHATSSITGGIDHPDPPRLKFTDLLRVVSYIVEATDPLVVHEIAREVSADLGRASGSEWKPDIALASFVGHAAAWLARSLRPEVSRGDPSR